MPQNIKALASLLLQAIKKVLLQGLLRLTCYTGKNVVV